MCTRHTELVMGVTFVWKRHEAAIPAEQGKFGREDDVLRTRMADDGRWVSGDPFVAGDVLSTGG